MTLVPSKLLGCGACWKQRRLKTSAPAAQGRSSTNVTVLQVPGFCLALHPFQDAVFKVKKLLTKGQSGL